ncbi:Piwi-domain-containing protein [Karstenula rhodostoma CBS 690.94]|uniref:Piwi-domain-containing protein n=1 Tax=Karstenula rhodostoma CBS 690.94 TaxID=1392251 RepID=A0A9P4PZ88_9PLEO|nr:Piwi-domain-containing protein [Karstenula rhodostoma CBS 690.94]
MPKPNHHGLQKHAKNQQSTGQHLQDLRKDEKTTITDQFLTLPCVRCGDDSHSCLDCPNTATSHNDGPYGSLNPGKKLGADKWVDELKKRHAANPRDLMFGRAVANREEQDRKRALEKQKQDGENEIEEKGEEKQGDNSSHEDSTPQPAYGMQELSLAPANQSSEGKAPAPQNATNNSEPVTTYRFDHDQSEVAARTAPTYRNLPPNFLRPDRQRVDMDLQNLRGQQLDYPARTEFTKHEPSTTLLTNHFQLGCEERVVLYEFKVPELEGKGKRKARAIMKSIIANFPVLRDRQTLFATDYFTTIVSWVDLRTEMNNAGHRSISTQGQAEQYHLLTFSDGPTTLRYERTVNIRELFDYARMDPNLPANTDTKQMINLMNIIVSKCAEESAAATIPGGANKFYLKDAHVPLGNGGSLCTHRGYSYTVKAGVGAVLLNVNSLTSAFWRPVLLHRVLDDDPTFGQMYWNVFEGVIQGLRVSITYERGDKEKDPDAYKWLNSEEGRIKTIVELGRRPDEEVFTPEGGKPTTVLDHYKRTYGPNFIQFPVHQLVNLGTRDAPRWYPAEKLRILAYQKYKGLVPSSVTNVMQATACQRPPEAKALVGIEGLETLGWAGDQTRNFALPGCSQFYLRPALLEVDGGTLGYPSIQYHNGTAKPPLKGRWSFKGLNLYKRTTSKYFSALVLCGPDLHKNVASTIFTNLTTWTSTRYRVATVNRAANVQLANLTHGAIDSVIQNELDQKASADMAMLVLRKNDIPGYSAFKDLCDRKFGLHAICVTSPAQKGDGDRWSNITLKMNLKAAGINHTIAKGKISECMKETLVLGADVTHPGPGSIPGCPSIAAIVGSVDQHAGRFLGSMRLQRESRKEIIDDVVEMVCERVRDWIVEMTPHTQKYVTLPKKIMYYRDGVSESQYDQVISGEVSTFGAAFNQVVHEFFNKGKVDPKATSHTPEIVAIICGKRHHVRFYPSSDGSADEFKNCHPGTTVDDVVTSPHYQDFYLQSHAGIKGTARPAHYFVVRNDPKTSLAELRQFRSHYYLRSYYVAPKKTAVRDEFDAFKRDAEKGTKAAREKDFPPPPKSEKKTRTARQPKSPDFVKRQEADRKKLEKKCDEYVTQKARAEFERYQKGGNPWHPNVSKTMFWM